jgi:hypothetical protein
LEAAATRSGATVALPTVRLPAPTPSISQENGSRCPSFRPHGQVQRQCDHRVDEFALQNHKSKDLRKRLDGIELNKKLLIVETGENANLDRASGNLDKVKLVSSKS